MLMTTNASLLSFFFFNDTATTEIYTLSLHDALPISRMNVPHTLGIAGRTRGIEPERDLIGRALGSRLVRDIGEERSEEHTSELQSHLNLVCRLLLEKKKIMKSTHSVDYVLPVAST